MLEIFLTCVVAALNLLAPCNAAELASFSLSKSSFSSSALTGAGIVDEKIVGGTVTTIWQHPYIVSVEKYFTEFPKWYHNCGGSVLNPYHILSAAHCIAEDPKAQYRVRAGSTYRGKTGVLVTVAKVFYHPKFDSQKLDWDVGLFRLKKALTYTAFIQPVRLPAIGQMPPNKFNIMGWGAEETFGFIYPEQLQATTVSLVSSKVCAADYKKIRAVTSRMLCAASPGKDACTGDSGGPMMKSGKDKYYLQFGIVSWGQDCANMKEPGVYVNLASKDIRQYINAVLKSK